MRKKIWNRKLSMAVLAVMLLTAACSKNAGGAAETTTAVETTTADFSNMPLVKINTDGVGVIAFSTDGAAPPARLTRRTAP